MIGPELNGVDGRQSGSVPDYAYSDANKKSGIVWNEATFKQYIKNPMAMVPGTKMTFVGINDEQKSTICGPMSASSTPGRHQEKIGRHETPAGLVLLN